MKKQRSLLIALLVACTTQCDGSQPVGLKPEVHWEELSGRIVWGDPTNRIVYAAVSGQVQAGLLFVPSKGNCIIYTRLLGTNEFRYPKRLNYPPWQYLFEVELRDTRNKNIPKTALGRKQGLPISSNEKWLRKSRPHSWLPYHFNQPAQAGFFQIDHYFDIRQSARYTLRVTVRLLQEATNNNHFEAFTLPAIEIGLDWPKLDRASPNADPSKSR